MSNLLKRLIDSLQRYQERKRLRKERRDREKSRKHQRRREPQDEEEEPHELHRAPKNEENESQKLIMASDSLVPANRLDRIESLILSVEKGIDGKPLHHLSSHHPSSSAHNHSAYHNGTTSGIFVNGHVSFWALLNLISRALHIAPFFALLFLIGCAVLLICCCWFWIWRCTRQKGYNSAMKDVVFKEELQGFGEEDMENRLGELHFSIIYRPNKSRLEISVLYATGLPVVLNDLPDSFVEVEVLDVETYEENLRNEKLSGNYPGRLDLSLKKTSKPMKTKTIPDDTSPVWNETFGIKMPLDEMLNRLILFLVYNYDPPTNRSSRIGEVLVYLKEFTPESFVGNVFEDKRFIKPTTPLRGDGDLCIMLMSRQTVSKNFVRVTLIEGRNLAIARQNILDGAKLYAEFTLYHNKRKLQRRTSPVMPCISEHPYFNHTEEFSFSINKPFENMGIKIAVYLYRSARAVTTKKLGKVHLRSSSDFCDSGQNLHWRQMWSKSQMNKPIARWHAL